MLCLTIISLWLSRKVYMEKQLTSVYPSITWTLGKETTLRPSSNSLGFPSCSSRTPNEDQYLSLLARKLTVELLARKLTIELPNC